MYLNRKLIYYLILIFIQNRSLYTQFINDNISNDQFMFISNDNIEIERKYVNSGQSIMLICDLPNNMPDGKVLFIKYDNKQLNPSISSLQSSGSSLSSSSSSSSASGLDIREDTDDERYEISQQYAWEWSLKINSISEEDSALYVCKVGDVIIKKFEIIVRVPPRIKEDTSQNQKIVKEGSSIEFQCLATGTPKPIISWYVINQIENSIKLIEYETNTNLKIENITRNTPRFYQCRASNNIPPSDTKNLTFSIEFAPEIEIKSRYDRNQNRIILNCSIDAYPLTNKHFWRKDGNYINDLTHIKYEIRNRKLNEFKFISQLIIKSYDEKQDYGLYECAAENDLKVAKMVFNLNSEINFISQTNDNDLNMLNNEMIPIGYSNLNTKNQSTKHQLQKQNKKFKLNNQPNNINLNNLLLNNNNNNNNQVINKKNRPSSVLSIDSTDSSSINNLENLKNTNNKKLHHQRNHNLNRLNTTKLTLSSTIDTKKSPYIILMNDEQKDLEKSRSTSDYNDYDLNDILNNNNNNNFKHSNLNQDSSTINYNSNRSNSLLSHFFTIYHFILLAAFHFYFRKKNEPVLI